MPRYEVEYAWTETHYGFDTVDAADEDEAVDIASSLIGGSSINEFWVESITELED